MYIYPTLEILSPIIGFLLLSGQMTPHHMMSFVVLALIFSPMGLQAF
jgi:hypothetical protein